MQLDFLHTRDLIVALGLPQAHLRDPDLRQADVRHRRQQPTGLRRVSQPADAIGILLRIACAIRIPVPVCQT